MNLFQKIYNAIKAWRAPEWFKGLLDFMFFEVVMPTIKQLGEKGYTELTRHIIDASKMDISGRKKFEYVYAEFCKGYGRTLGDVGESFINRAIELVFAELKERGVIE